MTNECAKEMFNNIRRYNEELTEKLGLDSSAFSGRPIDNIKEALEGLKRREIVISTKNTNYNVNFDDVELHDNYLSIKTNNAIYDTGYTFDQDYVPYDLSRMNIYDRQVGHIYFYREFINIPYEEIISIKDGIAAHVFKYYADWSGKVEKETSETTTVKLYD